MIRVGSRNAHNGAAADFGPPGAGNSPCAATAWQGHTKEPTDMISGETVHEIKRLLALGILSQREIAQRTGVGRTSVSGVASGQWDHRLAPTVADDECLPHQMVPAVRCPTCGGRVHPPCLLCHVRRLQEKKRRRREKTRCAAK